METTSKKRIYRVSELMEETKKSIQEQKMFQKGASCGFISGDSSVSYLKGFTTGIYSYSAMGKTQFYIQEAVHLSKAHNWVHAVWLTEQGRKTQMIADILQTYLGVNLTDDSATIKESELQQGLEWLDKHFVIIDHEEEVLSIKDILESAVKIQKELGIQLDSIGIDNATNLKTELGMDKATFMNYVQNACNRTAVKYNWHIFTLFHVNKIEAVECKETKKKFMPIPTHFDISGGQQINFTGNQLIGVYRGIKSKEDEDIINPKTGAPFILNEAWINVTKTKPKGIGEIGIFQIFFDRNRNQYYEVFQGQKYYCGEFEAKQKNKSKPSAMQPNVQFEKIELPEDSPFG